MHTNGVDNIKNALRNSIPLKPFSVLKHELKHVLSYLDQILESLPEDKIKEFAQSEYFDMYKKLFYELGF